MISRPARLLALLLMPFALWGLWIRFDAGHPYLGPAAPVVLDIAPGSSTRRIAEQLEQAGAIRSRRTFLVLHYLQPKQTLKAGTYSFEVPVSPREVFRKLALGEVSYETLTVPEGFNRFEIADLVNSGNFATREEFLKATMDTSIIADLDPKAPSLEGYLFPDTYQIPRHSGAASIARVMVNRFRRVYLTLDPGNGNNRVGEIVIMASLVEEETGKAEERPLVASVFYNRLERGIALQCDPTVIYAAILSRTFHGAIRQTNLDSPSPYNTYVHPGLPPGAIANPGRASLLAALHPAASRYLYFVANSTGSHTFSRTLAEHNLAVNLYRRGLPR